MTNYIRIARACLTGLVAASAIGPVAPVRGTNQPSLDGTIWVANRTTNTIRGFDASSGLVVNTVSMTPGSQPGDLAFAKGKLYVAEEMGKMPAIAVVDAQTGAVLKRFLTGMNSRPHHVHVSNGGNLIAVGLYGTDTVAVIDTHDDTLLGPWDSNPDTTDGKVHAGVFSNDGRTLYLASDATNEVCAIDPRTGEFLWSMRVPGAHELAATHNDKILYVTRRTANQLAVIDLENKTYTDVLELGMPDTLQLSANEKLLTVGLRTQPARLAVVDTSTFEYELVSLTNQAGTTGGHQWTSPSGRYTYASFEGGTTQGVAVVDHKAGNTVVQTFEFAGRPHGVDLARP